MKELDALLITSSPHLHEGESTSKIMIAVVLCLLPAGIWGVLLFGIYSLWVVLASVLASLVTEYIITRLQGRFTLNDGSALLTGLLVGYNMPPSIPLFIPVIASVFAIGVVKMTFGGLGRNWMNPALAGRVFVMFSWTGPMTGWLKPRIWATDAVTAASPLGFLKAGLLDYSGAAAGPMEFLKMEGYPLLSGMGRSGRLADLVAWLDGILPAGYGDLLMGNIPGCIGEVSALLLLLGSIYLFAKKIILWEIPLSYLLTFGLLTWIFGGKRYGAGFFQGDVFFHLFTGGLILGVFYMATDMVTSPMTSKGMLLFGVGAGFFTFLIRFFGSFPEGVSLAIILMNMFVPLINRFTRPVKFGYVREVKS